MASPNLRLHTCRIWSFHSISFPTLFIWSHDSEAHVFIPGKNAEVIPNYVVASYARIAREKIDSSRNA